MRLKNRMARLLGILIILVPLGALACGDGRMSVEEYAIACGNLGESVDQGLGVEMVSNFSEAIDFLEDTLDGLQALQPPVELERLHELKIAGSELALGVLREVGFDDLEKAEQELAAMSPEERQERSQEMMEDLLDRLSRMEEALLRLETELLDLQTQIESEQENLDPDTHQVMSREGCISKF